MFDVGFSELIVIGVVALLVLGPERMPKLARDVGRWIGRARRYVNRVREEIDREVELGELRRLRDEIEAKAREVAGEAEVAHSSAEGAVRSTLDQVAQSRDQPPTASTTAAPEPAVAVPRKRRERKRAAAPELAAEEAMTGIAPTTRKPRTPRARKRAVTPAT